MLHRVHQHVYNTAHEHYIQPCQKKFAFVELVQLAFAALAAANKRQLFTLAHHYLGWGVRFCQLLEFCVNQRHFFTAFGQLVFLALFSVREHSEKTRFFNFNFGWFDQLRIYNTVVFGFG